ncbi:hypothetical protein D3C72_1397210 [compost metagenome]
MAQAVQRVVDARCREQRQRLCLAGAGLPGAVGNAVIHGGQVRQVKHVAHQHPALGGQRAFDVVVLGKRKMDGNRVRAGAHLQLHVVAGAQQAKLLGVVVGEQVGPGEGGFIPPRAFHKAIGQLGVCPRHRGGVHAHERVERTHIGAGRLTGHKALHGLAQVANLLLVNALHLGQCVGRVGVAGGGDEVGNQGHAPIVHKPGTCLCDGTGKGSETCS